MIIARYSANWSRCTQYKMSLVKLHNSITLHKIRVLIRRKFFLNILGTVTVSKGELYVLWVIFFFLSHKRIFQQFKFVSRGSSSQNCCRFLQAHIA